MTEDVENGSGTPSKDSRRPRRQGQSLMDDVIQNNNTQMIMPAINHPPSVDRTSIPAAPASSGLHGGALPLTINKLSSSQLPPEPKLIHPFLNRLPLQFRFICNGVLSNVLFMVAYNTAVSFFNDRYAPSTIYSVVYLFYIPAGHLMVSLLVFGWPERYVPSLMSNFPIGLTALALGGALTAYLDRIEFNESIAEMVRDYSTFSTMPARSRVDDQGEFYSSLVILFVTGVWTYILSVYINAPSTNSEKKEL